jgi:pyruvate ferredoxin oxidoreductase beta subunit
MEREDTIRDICGEEYFKGGHLLCPGCTGGIFWRLITKVLGKNSINTLGATCISLPPAVFPSVLDIPSIYVSMATPAPLITGVSAGLRALKRKGKLAEEDNITVFAVAGDGGTADIGFAALSGAAERNDDGIYFCFDNEAYMNTGIQRSSETPAKTWTTSTLRGKVQAKKDLPTIMAAHRIPYVATASIGFPNDLIRKVKKAKDMGRGFRYIHTLCACAPGWRIPENKVIEISRLGVECGMWLLYEIEQGELRLTFRPSKRKPVREYLSRQGRFSHLSEEEVKATQDEVDEACNRYGF